MEFIGPLAVSALAWVIDLFFMIKDETADAKKLIKNGISAFIPLALFSFVSFNLDFISPYTASIPYLSDILLRVVLALILAIVIHAKSSVFGKGPGSHETWLHTIIVAAVVLAGPTVWSAIEPRLPWYSAPVETIQ